MQYTCANCEHTFESGDEKPRCPQCLRRHGLLAEDANSKRAEGRASASGEGATSRRRLLLGAGIVVLLLGAGVGAYYLLRPKPVDNGPRNVAMGPVSTGTLRDVARRRGAPITTVYHTADDAIRALGRTLGREPDGGKVAAAILAAIRRSLGPKGITVRRPGRPKPGAVLTASQLYGAMREKQAVTVYSYELACLYLAVARAAGLHAVLAEIYRHTDRKGPADPWGHIGYFGVAIYKSAGYSGRPAMVVDPARGTLNAAKEFEVLSDLQAVAHGMSLQAISMAEEQTDVAHAVEKLDASLRLAPRSATLLAAKGMFLMKSGGVAPALDAFRSARSVREDAPRYLLVALGHLAKEQAKGGLERAMSSLDQAISRDPGYAVAYVMKADILLKQLRIDEASAQLDKAQELEPELIEALLARAMILIVTKKVEQGIALLKKSVRLDPLDEQARFQLWRMLYQLDRLEEAKEAAKGWLASLSQARRAKVTQLMEQFREAFKAYKARQAPTAPGGDPYKLKMPGQGGGGFPGSPGTSPFPGQDKDLQL
ncbi:MAG: tetratricopeptide repeat protein [bacterium]